MPITDLVTEQARVKLRNQSKNGYFLSSNYYYHLVCKGIQRAIPSRADLATAYMKNRCMELL